MNDITVVLVEDHDVVRIELRSVLQIYPSIKPISEAVNGVQGLKLLQSNPPRYCDRRYRFARNGWDRNDPPISSISDREVIDRPSNSKFKI